MPMHSLFFLSTYSITARIVKNFFFVVVGVDCVVVSGGLKVVEDVCGVVMVDVVVVVVEVVVGGGIVVVVVVVVGGVVTTVVAVVGIGLVVLAGCLVDQIVVGGGVVVTEVVGTDNDFKYQISVIFNLLYILDGQLLFKLRFSKISFIYTFKNILILST